MPVLQTFGNASVRGWRGSSAAALPAFELISTQILASTASSVTFSSIPSTYKHLQVRLTMASSTALNDLAFQFNGDSGSNYAWHIMTGTSTSAVALAGPTQTSIRSVGHNGGQNASNWMAAIIDVLDFANTSKYKTAKVFGGYAYSSNFDTTVSSGLWMNTAAITSLTLFNSASGVYNTGSRFSLYGVRG